jgi:hypothetical protein
LLSPDEAVVVVVFLLVVHLPSCTPSSHRSF